MLLEILMKSQNIIVTSERNRYENLKLSVRTEDVLSEIFVISGQVLWLTSIIPALWEVKIEGSLEARSSRPAWATW